MRGHDSFKANDSSLNDVIEKLSPEFAQHTQDVREIAKHANDPLFLSLLLFALAKEREKTNALLDEINQRLARLELAREEKKKIEPLMGAGQSRHPKEAVILPEADQKIMDFIETRGMASAKEIMEVLSYKGLNAASQRLNKLYREGHLRKVRAGRKVMYLAKK